MGTRRARQGAIRAINHRMARSWYGFEHPQGGYVGCVCGGGGGGGGGEAADRRTRRLCWLCVCERGVPDSLMPGLGKPGLGKPGLGKPGLGEGAHRKPSAGLVRVVELASHARSESLRFKRALTIRVSSRIEAHCLQVQASPHDPSLVKYRCALSSGSSELSRSESRQVSERTLS